MSLPFFAFSELICILGLFISTLFITMGVIGSGRIFSMSATTPDETGKTIQKVRKESGFSAAGNYCFQTHKNFSQKPVSVLNWHYGPQPLIVFEAKATTVLKYPLLPVFVNGITENRAPPAFTS